MDDDTSRKKNAPTSDYEVGYCRPPVEHRFKSGEVHNRRGRPRKALTFDEALKRVLAEKIPIRIGEEVVRVTKGEVIARRLVDRYGKGDAMAQRLVLSLLVEFDRDETAEQVPSVSGILEVSHEFLNAFDDALDEEQQRNPGASYDEQRRNAWQHAQRVAKRQKSNGGDHSAA